MQPDEHMNQLTHLKFKPSFYIHVSMGHICTFISHTNMHYIQHDCIVELGLGSMRKRWFGAPRSCGMFGLTKAS
jgi:hypothetical protein